MLRRGAAECWAYYRLICGASAKGEQRANTVGPRRLRGGRATQSNVFGECISLLMRVQSDSLQNVKRCLRYLAAGGAHERVPYGLPTQSNVPNVSQDDVHRGLCNLAAECRTRGSLAVSRYANDAAKVFDATEIDAANRRVW